MQIVHMCLNRYVKCFISFLILFNFRHICCINATFCSISQQFCLSIEAQSVSATEDVYNDDSAITAHHSTIDPYAVSEDPKFTSYCHVISTVRSMYPEVLDFMMNNKAMVKIIHDVTFNMHSTTKQDPVHIPSTRTIPSCVTAKPPPMKETHYPEIGKEENFLKYILRCGGTSTKSAGVVLSRVLHKHAHAFVTNDTALIHLFQFIIFATVLS